MSSPIKNAERAKKYYTEMAKDTYYANRHETAGRWSGAAAGELGLSGNVRAEDFRKLLDGFSPDGSKKLVQNAESEKRQCGWDLTFSPPKSMSMFWAMAPPDARAKIEAAHLAAVEEALDYLQDAAAITRRGQGGKHREKAFLVVAIFEHAASRALDPDLHSHAIVINLALRNDGTWGTLHSRDIFDHRFNAQMIYHIGLALRLRIDIGLLVQLDKVAFRVVCVPDDLCQTCSKRRQAIQKFMAQHGLKGTAAAKLAALKTRPKKQNLSRDELFSYWHRIGQAHGWGPEQAEQAYRQAVPIDFDKADYQSRLEDPHDRRESKRQESFASANTDSGRQQQRKAQSESDSEEEQRRKAQFESANSASNEEQSNESKRKKDRVFRKSSKNTYQFKNRKWGDILWQKKRWLFEIRVQKKRVFPKAPAWSPVSKLEFRALRIIPKKIKLQEDTPPWKKPEAKVHWKKNLLVAELQCVDKELFPDAPWSLARRLKLRRLRFAKKTPKSHTQSQSDESKKGQSQSNGQQSQSH